MGRGAVRPGRPPRRAAAAARAPGTSAPRRGPGDVPHVHARGRRVDQRALAADADRRLRRPSRDDADPPCAPRHGRPARRPGRGARRAERPPHPARGGPPEHLALPRVPGRRRRRPPAHLAVRPAARAGPAVRLVAARVGRPAAGVPRRPRPARRRDGRPGADRELRRDVAQRRVERRPSSTRTPPRGRRRRRPRASSRTTGSRRARGPAPRRGRRAAARPPCPARAWPGRRRRRGSRA